MIPIENEKRIIDWNAIKAEYIGGGISQRKLAKKYGISETTLMKRANRDGWGETRRETASKCTATAQQRTAIAAADNATLAANIKRMGLEIIAGLFEDYANVRATEHRETKGKTTDIKRLRDLTAAFKDLTGDMVTNQAEDNALLRSLYDIERGMRDD